MAPIAAKGLGGALKVPSGYGRSPAVKRFLVHFKLKMKYLAMMGFNTFSRPLPLFFLPIHPQPPYSALLFPTSPNHTAPPNTGRLGSIPFPDRQLRLLALEKHYAPLAGLAEPDRQAFFWCIFTSN